MIKHILLSLALSIVFQAQIIAQITLIDTVTSNSSDFYLRNIDGEDGSSFYANIDKDTYQVTIKDMNKQQIAQFRPFANDPYISVAYIRPLKPSEWSGNEAEYIVGVNKLSSPASTNGTSMTGIYTSSGRVVFEVRESARLLRRTDGSSVIANPKRSPDSVEILLFPGLVNIGSFPETYIRHLTLGDGSAYYQTFRSGTEYPYTKGVRRYNDDFSLRYSYETKCTSLEVISGNTLNDNSDNLFFSIDSTYNNEDAHYLAIIDLVGNVKMDTFIRDVGSIQADGWAEGPILVITVFPGEPNKLYVDKKTLTFIDLPDGGWIEGIINNQNILLFPFADTSRTIAPYYDAITYDSLGAVPYNISNNGISYSYPSPISPRIDKTFGGASFVYAADLRDSIGQLAYLFVDDQFQPIAEFFTPVIINGSSYQYSVDNEAYFSTSIPDGSERLFRNYSIYKFDYQASSTEDFLESSINVYPNPSNGWITIKDQFDTPISSLSLVSNVGRLVKTWERPNTGEKLVFDVPKGIYNLVVRMDNDQIRSKRIVIQ